MELKQIKELMAAMGRSGIKKIVLKKEGDFELQLERDGIEAGERSIASSASFGGYLEQDGVSSPFVFNKPPDLPPTPVVPLAPAAPAVDANSKYVTSPMVGTFYASPSPDDPPFVKVGDRIEAGTVVCIVEAMKVMNEVKAGVAGVVTEVLINNGQPVEFGTKIYRVV